VADHADLIGIATDIKKGTPNILADATAKSRHERSKKGGAAFAAATFDLIKRFSQMTLPNQIVSD
jgi:hypothetical protein